ncbi:MAG TPA: hypothetical protein OIL97_04750 [Oscillospiraceae bacterium]|nr:hypothetical protein [Oscillospiraceae bacterium]
MENLKTLNINSLKNRIVSNNGEFLRIEPSEDCIVLIYKEAEDGKILKKEKISGADFVMMLNWYHYQKSTGNSNLMF